METVLKQIKIDFIKNKEGKLSLFIFTWLIYVLPNLWKRVQLIGLYWQQKLTEIKLNDPLSWRSVICIYIKSDRSTYGSHEKTEQENEFKL